MNAFYEDNQLWLRDVHFYNERYPERYLNSAETSNGYFFDNLPFTEGRLWSQSPALGGENFRAGLYFCGADGSRLTGSQPSVEREPEGNATRLCWDTDCGTVEVDLTPDVLSVRFSQAGCYMENVWLSDGEEPIPFRSCNEQSITACHNGFTYRLMLEAGSARLEEKRLILFPNKDGLLCLNGRCVQEGD